MLGNMDDKVDLLNAEIDNSITLTGNLQRFTPEIGDLVLFINEKIETKYLSYKTLCIGQIKDIIVLADYYIVRDSSNALYRVSNVYPITPISAMAQWSMIRPLDL